MLASSSIGAREEKGSSQPLVPPGAGLPFSVLTALFFLWGVPNNLNDVLIRQFMKSFAISRFEAGLVQSAFYLGYFLLAIPAALLMRRLGYKPGILIGLVLFGLGAGLFLPAALIGRYGFFLAALFVIASGLSFLETASNPLIAQMGAPESAARRLNLAQAFNPLGAIAGVLLGTIFIFSGVELTPAQVAAMRAAHTYRIYLRHETMRVVAPYLILGAIALLWSALIARTEFPSIATAHGEGGEGRGNFRALLRYPHFLLAIFAQFLYVGAQVGIWSYFIQYVQDSTHQPEKIAGYLLTGTLGAFALGRFSSASLMRYVKPNLLMGLYALINVVLTTVGVVHPGWIGLWALFCTSFFMSNMFPTIFALGIDGLGGNTKIGGSLIIMSIVGGAVLTPVMGLVSQWRGGIAAAYVVPAAAFCYIAFYGFVGSRLRPRPTAAA